MAVALCFIIWSLEWLKVGLPGGPLMALSWLPFEMASSWLPDDSQMDQSCRWSPIPVLMRPDVEQPQLSMCYQ